MSSPERLNVLLSRARNGLIIIGNSETFLKSRSGKEIWSKFFDMVKRLGYLYDGLPVQCEQHNGTKNVLKLPEDFGRLCPDGGCSEPWFVQFLTLFCVADCLNPRLHSGIVMGCGIHACPRKCHKPQDHKDLTCGWKVQTELPCGHSVSRKCCQSKTPPDACLACNLAKRKAETDKAAGENGAGSNDRPSTPIDSRPPTSPTSPWRVRQTAATTGNGSGSWRSGRSTDNSTNIFDNYCGPRRSTDTYKDGLFNRSKPQSDSSYSFQGDSDRKGSWRPTRPKW